MKGDTMKPKAAMTMNTEPEAVRRKLAEQLRKLAGGRRFTPEERKEYARMAEMWEKTLPKKS